MTQVNLNKTVKEKNQYQKVIDTSFTQLVQPVVTEPEIPTDEKISKFFNDYQDLFYDIPKEGETNSHTYLIKQSSDYVDNQVIDEDVQALLDEIASLREENLELQQQIIDQSTNR
jgi:hypothetical protein